MLLLIRMKKNAPKRAAHRTQTLAELVETVVQLTHNERLGAYIVADMINSRLVRLEGKFQGRRVVIG
jgi:hypothetical protein